MTQRVDFLIAPGSATPMVDSYVVDQLRVPAGFLEWARSVESRCLTTRARLNAMAPIMGESHLGVTEEARSEIEIILDDSPRGVLRRLLVRPPWQVGAESPARNSLERRVQSAVALASEACSTQALVAKVVARVNALRDTYHGHYPNVLAESLRKARAEDADLLRCRREADATLAEGRVQRLEAQLARRHGALEILRLNPADWSLADDEQATAFELGSLCALFLSERIQRLSRSLRAEVRTVDLFEHLASVPPRLADPSETAAAQHGALLEDLLARALRTSSELRLRGAEAPLWVAALSASVDTGAFYKVRSSALRASVQPRPTVPTDGPNVIYVVPITDDLVLLSREHRSPIRVWTARVSLGRDIEAQVVGELLATADEEGLRDVRRVFDGTGTDSGWYRPHSRLKGRVIAEFSQGWIVRIRRRGAVRRVHAAAWERSAPEPSAFRLLVRRTAEGESPGFDAADIASADGVAVGEHFAGFSTTEVRTSLPGDQLAWRRRPANRGKAAERALEAEWILLRTLNRRPRSRVRTLEPLLWTAPISGRREPLFRSALAVTSSNTRVFDSLVSLNSQWRLHTIGCIAKCMHEVHDTGAVMGTVHRAQFVYQVEPNGRGLLAVPRPVLAYAPATCRIGERHVADTRLEHSEVLYDKLRLPLLNPFAATGHAANVEHDIYSFGVAALDLLAKRPLVVGRLFYTDLVDAVKTHGDCFAEPELAIRIAESMASDPALTRLKSLVAAICSGLGVRTDKWLAVI